MNRNLIKAFLCCIVLLATSIFIACDDDREKKNSTKQYQKDVQIIDSNESENFNYKYKVDVNSNKIDSRYIPIKFTLDIEAKENTNFEMVSAMAYIDDLVFNNIAVKGYNTFGISEESPLTIDMISSDSKGFSIATDTWLYKDTNLDKLIRNLQSGIKVKVVWDKKEEYVLVRDVEINKI